MSHKSLAKMIISVLFKARAFFGNDSFAENYDTIFGIEALPESRELQTTILLFASINGIPADRKGGVFRLRQSAGRRIFRPLARISDI